MAEIATPPFLQFFDSNGDPLSGGKLFTYSAGTLTQKQAFTDQDATTPTTNPIILDAAGRATFYISGSYRYRLFDSNDVLIEDTDDVNSFTSTSASGQAYFESFSGNGTQTTFTTSQDLGTDEKLLMVYVDQGLQEYSTNGTFATDTDWTKGTGWTIGSGVATASGAISTAIEQTSNVTLIEGQSYTVTMTITASVGGLIPSIGGTNGTERTSSGTYTETIIAGSTQVIAFTGNGFTGTLDDVSVIPVQSKGFDIQPPTNYTINGTSLTFNTAPASGNNNIQVWAPSELAAAAGASADAAAASATAAAASASSSLAGTGFQYGFDTDTTATDPGAGDVKFNNATLASVTEVYISETTDQSQSIGEVFATWDDSDSTVKGVINIFKQSDQTNFIVFNLTSVTDNGDWQTFAVTHVDSGGSFSADDTLTVKFTRTGDKGDTGPQGPPGTGVGSTTVDLFLDGTDYTSGTTTQLTFSVTPSSKNNTDIYFDGVYQEKSEWSLAGSVVTFTSAIPLGTTSVEAVLLDDVDIGTPSNGTVGLSQLAAATQGDILYYGASGNAAYLSAGTSGQVLQTGGAGANPSWQDAAGGGLILLGSFTASNSTSVDIGSGLDLDAAIDGTYDLYRIVGTSIIPATDNQLLYMYTSSNTGSTFDVGASDYEWSLIEFNANDTSPANSHSAADSKMQLSNNEGTGSSTGEHFNFTIEIYDPSNSSLFSMLNGRSNYVGAVGVHSIQGTFGGMRQSAAIIDAVRIAFASGNISSGEFYLYGIKKS